jgi:RNA polymerase sigma factor (sigma-70 family)
MFSRKKPGPSSQSPAFSDEEVLQSIQQGGAARERVLGYLYQQYFGYVKQATKKYPMLSWEDLEDAYAETLVGFTRQVEAGKFRGDSKVATYLYRGYFNKVVDKIRRAASHRVEWADAMPELPDEARNMLGQMVESEQFKAILSRLDQLGDKCKRILLDSEYYGYSLDEVAERVGAKNAATISTLKHRCMQRLRKMLGIKK